MTTFVLYMALHPEIQRLAHDEIQVVLGKDSLPTWEDAKRLPYVCAVLKEVLRIAPVASLGTRPPLLGLLMLTLRQALRIAWYAKTSTWATASRKALL